ncbi:NAD(P)H-dependent flavin oxidoreductase [Rathayibacter soli]|uniref:NAD(P)H-dependent flavin oxidoreductase n=1 Tax=Rathayibacter soli TaxID=3144168 RepID=UPI0027E566A4|nr:nitronate monooxygenase [Glaciibacter superstes]
MPGEWKQTRFTRLAGIDLPIVLGAFGGASSTALVAAVSNAGGLGSFGLYGMGPDAITRTATEIRAQTSEPFLFNLWLPLDDTGAERSLADAAATSETDADADAYNLALEPLTQYFTELGLPLPERPERYLVPFDEQIDATIAAHPSALSFVYGVPDAALVDRCHSAGIRVVGTATTVAEARALDAVGVDAIIATGFEAAGHRVSFLEPAEDSLVGTIALVPRVVDAVRVPVIAAGGIADGRGVAAVLALGASAAQLGTAFLACDESAANPPHRTALWEQSQSTSVHAIDETVLTRAFSGRLARGIPNRMSRELNGEYAAFPVQGWITGYLKRAAAATGNPDFTSLWAGQGVSLIREHTAAAVVEAIIHDVDAILR